MHADLSRADLATLIAELEAVTGKVRQNFGRCSAAEINWKPDAQEWSIGQCLDHLIVSNTCYFADLRRLPAGEKRSTFWERLPILPDFFASFLLRALNPDKPQQVKAPKIFEPSSSALDAEIVERFAAHQQELIGLMQASAHLELERIIITSPVAPFVVYSLMNAYRIITVHEQLHLQQARQVMSRTGFPALARAA